MVCGLGGEKMLFLGNTFCGYQFTADATPIKVFEASNVVIQNGIFDDLFITRDLNTDLDNKAWDFPVVLWANFNGSLHGGNIDITLGQLDSVLIKRREKGTFEFITLAVLPVGAYKDLALEHFDKYNRAGVEYEYAIVPQLGGVEGSMSINEVWSEFNGLFIVEKDITFRTVLEYTASRQRNISNVVVETLDSKYPFVISNSRANYDLISVTGCFIPYDEYTDTFKSLEGYRFRDDLMDFLGNGRAKIVKLEDGRIWLIGVTSDPIEQQESRTHKFVTSFDCAEIGKFDNTYDLYNAGMIDFDVITNKVGG